MDTGLANLLIGLGLTNDQAQLYQSLLELGGGTVQEIAKHAGVKRSSAYYIIEQLEKRGIVYQTKHRKRTLYMAEKPETILGVFEKRVEQFKLNIERFHAIENHNVKKPKIYLFEGTIGFKKIWHTLFESGVKEYLIITDPREFLSFVRKGYITSKIIQEKKARGIHSRQLIAFSEYAKEIIAKDKIENRISKILPHQFPLPFTTIIFGNTIALIAPSRENFIVMIESEGFAKTQTSMFEALWEKL